MKSRHFSVFAENEEVIMSRYLRKVLIAVGITLLVAALPLLSGDYLASVLLAVAGMSFIVLCHFSRCPECSSWRTSRRTHYSGDNHNPGYGTTYEITNCRSCKKSFWSEGRPSEDPCKRLGNVR